MPDVDAWVIGHVVDRLSRPDAVDLLVDRKRTDLAELRDKAAGLRARQDELAAYMADPDIPMAKVKSAAATIAAKLQKVESKMLHANNARVFDGVIGEKDVAAKFNALGLDRQRAIVDVLYEITIHPGQAPRGAFNEDLVTVVPKVC